MNKALRFVGAAAWDFVSCPNDGIPVTIGQAIARGFFIVFMLMATWLMLLIFAGSNDKISQTGAAVSTTHAEQITPEELDLRLNQAKMQVTEEGDRERLASMEVRIQNLTDKLVALETETVKINTIVDRQDKTLWAIWGLILERIGSFVIFAIRKKKDA